MFVSGLLGLGGPPVILNAVKDLGWGYDEAIAADATPYTWARSFTFVQDDKWREEKSTYKHEPRASSVGTIDCWAAACSGRPIDLVPFPLETFR